MEREATKKKKGAVGDELRGQINAFLARPEQIGEMGIMHEIHCGLEYMFAGRARDAFREESGQDVPCEAFMDLWLEKFWAV